MAPLPDYVAGTITLTNGDTAFTGNGTGWLAAGFREGDTILGIEDNEGVVYVVETVTDNDAGTLTQPWQGVTGTYTYRMRYLSDGQRVTAQARQLIEMLGNGNLQALAGLDGTPNTLAMFTGAGAMVEVARTDLVSGANYDVQVDTLPDRAAYDGSDAGFAVLVNDTGDGRAAIYSKLSNASADWSGPAYVTGPVGPEPEITIGAVARGDADVTSTPVAGGYELDFTIPSQVAQGDYAGATAYVTGDIVQDQGSSWVALQPTTGNAPPTLPTTSNAFWQLLARAGNDGAGTVTSLAAGDGIDIDSTDPTMPVVSVAERLSSLQADIPGDDCNNITESGWYRVDTTDTNAPPGLTVGASPLLHINGANANFASQIVIDRSTAVMFVRVNSNSTYSSWTTMFGRGNILGTVSQSSGVPTGAVIERGSNANGEYVRYADGTQQCWHGVAGSSGGTSTINTTWTYPVAFTDTPFVTVGLPLLSSDWTVPGDRNSVVAYGTNGVLSSSADVQIRFSTTVTVTVSNIGVVAIGRWF